MRTTMPLAFVLAIGIAAFMWQGSGYSAAVGAHDDPISDLNADDQLEEQANNSSYGDADGGGFSGSVGSSDESDVIGFIINGSKGVGNIIGLALLLPLELRNLGFPLWFAFPVGLVTQLLMSLGLIQFAANRVLR